MTLPNQLRKEIFIAERRGSNPIRNKNIYFEFFEVKKDFFIVFIKKLV